MSKKNDSNRSKTMLVIDAVISAVLVVMFVALGVYSAFVLKDTSNTIMSMIGICMSMMSFYGLMFGDMVGTINEYLESKDK